MKSRVSWRKEITLRDEINRLRLRLRLLEMPKEDVEKVRAEIVRLRSELLKLIGKVTP